MAAYIDGALNEEEASRVTEHLASCEDCFEVYSETLRFQLDSEAEADQGKVMPFPPPQEERRPHPPTFAQRLRPRRWLPIAALLLVGVGTAYSYLLRTLPALKTAEVAASIPNRPVLFDEENGIWFGPRLRGSGASGEPEIPLDEAAFRTGVQLVNLQVSLKAGKRVEAQDAISAIFTLLESSYGTQDLQNKYTALTGSLNEQKAPAAFLPQATRLADETREVFLADDDPALDLGQWVEAGRLAAIAKDPSFFQESENRSFLRRFLWREKLGLGDTKLDPAARESLRQIAATASKGDLTADDFKSLRGQFDRVLEIYYPET